MMDEKSGLTGSTSSSMSSDGAIYHSMSPSKKLALQAFFVCVGLAVLASLVVCFVLGSTNRALYMLGVNQCITLVNCLVLLKWYLSGTLPQNWLWYLVAVGIFLVIQSAITDIMVSVYPYSPAPPAITTTPPPITHPTNATTNATTHVLPTTTAPNGTTLTGPVGNNYYYSYQNQH